MVKTCAEALGLQAVALDLGWSMPVRIWVDSTAAKAIACRTGLGKVRHLEVAYLWVQQALKDRKFSLHKVAGQSNPADVLTKPLSATDMGVKLALVSGVIVPKLKAVKKRWADESDTEAEAGG
jgi:hypothetical protein